MQIGGRTTLEKSSLVRGGMIAGARSSGLNLDPWHFTVSGIGFNPAITPNPIEVPDVNPRHIRWKSWETEGVNTSNACCT